MPIRSKAQGRLMQAVAHSPEFAAKVGIPQRVGREFIGKAAGGAVPLNKVERAEQEAGFPLVREPVPEPEPTVKFEKPRTSAERNAGREAALRKYGRVSAPVTQAKGGAVHNATAPRAPTAIKTKRRTR